MVTETESGEAQGISSMLAGSLFQLNSTFHSSIKSCMHMLILRRRLDYGYSNVILLSVTTITSNNLLCLWPQ